jgi:hypothetical protein
MSVAKDTACNLGFVALTNHSSVVSLVLAPGQASDEDERSRQTESRQSVILAATGARRLRQPERTKERRTPPRHHPRRADAAQRCGTSPHHRVRRFDYISKQSRNQRLSAGCCRSCEHVAVVTRPHFCGLFVAVRVTFGLNSPGRGLSARFPPVHTLEVLWYCLTFLLAINPKVASGCAKREDERWWTW